MEKVMFRHSEPVREENGQPIKSQPRVTVAGIVKDDTLRIGVARCSRRDQFCKRTGRSVAKDRAASNNPFTVVTITEGVDVRKMFAWLANGIVREVANHPISVTIQKPEESTEQSTA